MARIVSKVYGEALFEFAKENNQLEKIYEESLDIIDVFSTEEDISKFLLSPKTTDEEKIEFLKSLFVDNIWKSSKSILYRFFKLVNPKGENQKIIDFLAIIIKKGRQKDIVAILKHFIHLVLQDKNIGEAEVYSAMPLSETQKERLEEKLINSTQFDKFIVNYNVDESLIAGLKIKIDDKVYDTTYKTKLFDISKNLRGLKLWLI